MDSVPILATDGIKSYIWAIIQQKCAIGMVAKVFSWVQFNWILLEISENVHSIFANSTKFCPSSEFGCGNYKLNSNGCYLWMGFRGHWKMANYLNKCNFSVKNHLLKFWENVISNFLKKNLNSESNKVFLNFISGDLSKVASQISKNIYGEI
jgi:hypothetical protein